jgi:membrane protein YdbS with pleckstrin-like domain
MNDTISNKKLILQLKPNPKSILLHSIIHGITSFGLILIIMYGIAAFFVYLFYTEFYKTYNFIISHSIIVPTIIGIATILGIWNFFFRFMNLRARIYKIYNDKIEWEEGFLRIRKISIPLTRVTDIGLYISLVDRFIGTGSIIINTAGSGIYNTAVIEYIDNAEEIEKMLKNLIDENIRKMKTREY